VDEVRIWNIARTNVQITSAWNKAVPNNSANLIAYYKMDEGSGTSLTDASGHGNTGTLFNTPTWINPGTAPINYYTAYIWSPGGATTSTISATSSANYTVNVTNANGCTASASFMVTVNPLPTFSVTPTNVSCFGGSDGSITVSIITGTTPFEYSRNNGTNYTAPTSSTTHTFTGLNTAGSPYLIKVRDGNTCVSQQTCP
jgi:hypothetical protein